MLIKSAITILNPGIAAQAAVPASTQCPPPAPPGVSGGGGNSGNGGGSSNCYVVLTYGVPQFIETVGGLQPNIINLQIVCPP